MKEWTKEFNPFNSNKLYAHIPRWSKIQRGEEIPAPALVTIDPTNKCNLSCVWCNSEYLRSRNSDSIPKDKLKEIADFLPEWGVDAVCIAGGGEPTIHPYLGQFVNRLLNNGTKVGLVTNGALLDIHDLERCTWVGVSVDAGTDKTYSELKGSGFNRTLINIGKLTEKHGELSKEGQGHGVSYKYLLHPRNVGEVYVAADLAKKIGCRNMHIRPMGNPWDRKLKDTFSYGDIETFKEQLQQARELEDDKFRIFGITHKFDGNFQKSNQFDNCYAIFMTADFQPNGKGYNLGLCCDRRGDKRLTLEDMNPDKIKSFWGSDKHWEMFDNIRTSECPRCTYQPHNKIYQEAIKTNNLTWEFI